MQLRYATRELILGQELSNSALDLSERRYLNERAARRAPGSKHSASKVRNVLQKHLLAKEINTEALEVTARQLLVKK
jgi:hypothetical protein